jgi:DNA uptake protein ComE-like DNA-binding protein
MFLDALGLKEKEGSSVMGKTRINLANPQELLEIPGFDPPKVDAVVKHRAKHGPIADPAALAKVVGSDLTLVVLAAIDFAPAGDSATESAGG